MYNNSTIRYYYFVNNADGFIVNLCTNARKQLISPQQYYIGLMIAVFIPGISIWVIYNWQPVFVSHQFNQ